MEDLVWETAEEMNLAVAKRMRGIRKRRKLSQEELSIRSGVSYGTIKLFEQTGKISFISLTKLACALGCRDQISALFDKVQYLDISEVLLEND